MIPDATVLAYIAGIIDGEGCICIYTTKRRTTTAGQMKVVVANTNRALLEFLKLHFGGSISARNNITYNPRSKQCFEWIVASRKALYLLQFIEPYLRLKKLQAQVAVEYQLQRRNRGCRLTDKEKAVAEAQKITMNRLNKKGR